MNAKDDGGCLDENGKHLFISTGVMIVLNVEVYTLPTTRTPAYHPVQ